MDPVTRKPTKNTNALTAQEKKILFDSFEQLGQKPEFRDKWIYSSIWHQLILMDCPELREKLTSATFKKALTMKYLDMEYFHPRAINASGIYKHTFTCAEAILPTTINSKTWTFYRVRDPEQKLEYVKTNYNGQKMGPQFLVDHPQPMHILELYSKYFEKDRTVAKYQLETSTPAEKERALSSEEKEFVIMAFERIGRRTSIKGKWFHESIWLEMLWSDYPGFMPILSLPKVQAVLKEKYWDRELFSPKAINSNGVYLYNFTSKEKILPIDPAPKKWEFYCVTDRGEQISRPIGNPFDFLDDNPQEVPEEFVIKSEQEPEQEEASLNVPEANGPQLPELDEEQVIRTQRLVGAPVTGNLRKLIDSTAVGPANETPEMWLERATKRQRLLEVANEVSGEFWDMIEARRLLAPQASEEDDVRQIVQDRVELLGRVMSSLDGWKEILKVPEVEGAPESLVYEYIPKEYVFNLRANAALLRRGYQVALQEVSRGKTVKECFEIALHDCHKRLGITTSSGTTNDCIYILNRKFRDTGRFIYKKYVKIPKRVIRQLHKPKYAQPLLEASPEIRKSIVEFGRRVNLMGGRLDIKTMQTHVHEWLRDVGETDSNTIRKYQRKPPSEEVVRKMMQILGFKYDVKEGFNGNPNNKWIYVGEASQEAEGSNAQNQNEENGAVAQSSSSSSESESESESESQSHDEDDIDFDEARI